MPEVAADWLLHQGRVNGGVSLAEAIAALAPLRDPADVAPAHNRLGTACRDAGRQPEARTTLQQALAGLGPQPQGKSAALAVQIQANLALLARDQHQPEQAEAACTAALTLLTTTDAGQEPNAWAFVLSQQRDFLTTKGRPRTLRRRPGAPWTRSPRTAPAPRIPP